jgi:hypothetical protein
LKSRQVLFLYVLDVELISLCYNYFIAGRILSHPQHLACWPPHHINLINTWWMHKNCYCRQRNLINVRCYRDAYSIILACNIWKDANKDIINTNTRQTVISFAIKANTHSGFPRPVLISNNVSHCINIIILEACVPDSIVQQIQSL